MRLTARDVEAAFVETAREQLNGEPFNWQRTADLLNKLLRRREPASAFTWADR
jgi:hypothetical protein